MPRAVRGWEFLRLGRDINEQWMNEWMSENTDRLYQYKPLIYLTISMTQPISILLYYFTRSCWYTSKTVEAILRVSVSVYVYIYLQVLFQFFPLFFFFTTVYSVLCYPMRVYCNITSDLLLLRSIKTGHIFRKRRFWKICYIIKLKWLIK